MTQIDRDRLIRRIGTSDQVANLLRKEILAGQLTPGTPLREVALANSLGVSRNTIREGIRILVSEGILHHNVHRGVAVAELSRMDIADIYGTRRVLEVAAVRAARPDEAQLTKLRELAASLESAARRGTVQDLVDLDLTFHLELVGLMGLDRLSAFAERMLAELRVGLFIIDASQRGQAKGWARVHTDVCELLEQGKRADCARLLDRHLREAEELLGNVLDGS